MPADDLLDLYKAHLIETECTDATIRTFMRTLWVMDRMLPCGLDVATEREIRAWIWRDGLKASSRNNYYSAVVGFFRWAVDHAGVLNFDPTRRINRPKVPPGIPRVAPDDHVRRVLTEADDPFRLWAAIAAYEGARCIEIFRMRREDVTAARTTIPRGKGNKPRVVPTHPIVWTAVEPLPPGYIVTTHDHENLMSLTQNGALRYEQCTDLGLRGDHSPRRRRRTRRLDVVHPPPAGTTAHAGRRRPDSGGVRRTGRTPA